MITGAKQITPDLKVYTRAQGGYIIVAPDGRTANSDSHPEWIKIIEDMFNNL